MKLASFDIFDTALVRRCGEPEAVLWLMASELWPLRRDIQAAFVTTRMQAAHSAGRDATLAQIYTHFDVNEFAPYSAQELAEKEMSKESEILMVNPIVKQLIVQLRNEGWTIKYLSDMYLSSQFLTSVLIREDLLNEGEEVIVSCEQNARKDTGTLYKKVRELYHPKKWKHFGDNLHSDVRMARKCGVKGSHLLHDYTDVERDLLSYSKIGFNPWQYQSIAGLMRASRLGSGNTPGAVLASDFVASLYVPYVEWVLRESRSKGIQRLYFLSRDGYIMHQIAENLPHDGIELNYLFVSRKAITGAYLCSDNASSRFMSIVDRNTLIGKYVDVMLDKIGLSSVELVDKYGISFAYKRIANKDQESDFLNKIFNDNQLSSDLQAKWKKEKDMVISYFNQEGLTEEISQAMVDIGWLGTTRLMINTLLERKMDRCIPTFYVSTRSDVYRRTHGDYNSFFPLNSLDTAATGLIENYFSASPWPSTLSYVKNNEGRIDPVFKESAQFSESEAVKNNVSTAIKMSKMCASFIHLLSDEALFTWAKISSDTITSISYPIDLSPIADASDFDGRPVVRRMSALLLMKTLLTGAPISDFNRGSLEYSLGHNIASVAFKFFKFSKKLREILYRRIVLKY